MMLSHVERPLIVDLNSDLGEGVAQEADLLPLITTANVACGAHAGDAPTMVATLRLAAQHGVRVGAHPGFFDREYFGRRELMREPADVLADCLYQVGALQALADQLGLRLTHIKPHGALYNLVMRRRDLADALVEVARQFRLPLMGLPGSCLERACQGVVPYIAEGFADRRYRPDGSLVPRSESGSVIESADEAVAQALDLIRRGVIRSLCVHGDHPKAIEFVRHLREALGSMGVQIQAVS